MLCECLLILKGAKDVSWKAARTVMAEADFLKNLQEMNCDTISQKQLTAVKNHMKVLGAISVFRPLDYVFPQLFLAYVSVFWL